MALYEMTSDRLAHVTKTSFAAEGIRERQDLQRLLLQQMDAIDPGLLVLAEEFGYWDESSRRIDILALDRRANLVVIELKRSHDGGHLELQALRYAALVSTMTFEQACHALERHRVRAAGEADAESEILAFLEWDEPDEEAFGNGVRIVLASEDFSKEVTSTVLWLNERGLEIRCLRLSPYRLDDRLLIDVQQIIPLPESQEFQVRVRDKSELQRRASREKPSLAELWKELERNCTSGELEAARAIEAWLERNTAFFTTKDGFAGSIQHAGNEHYPLKVRMRGEVRLWFQYLANKPPFADEGLRLELRDRLNVIPGIEIGRNRIAGKPKIELAALVKPESRAAFLAALDWVVETIRSHGPEAPERVEGSSPSQI